MERCAWCLGNDIDRRYHDEEWGRPIHDEIKHFEFLSLEAMQCGLSWSIILRKREILRECFSGFDYVKIARYNDDDVQRIMNTVGMIRSERKIRAIISNAAAFEQIREEFGSFDKYIWSFTNNHVHVYLKHHRGGMETHNSLSEQISKDLKKRGFKFLGAVCVYSYLQACGIINDHSPQCFAYRELSAAENVTYIK